MLFINLIGLLLALHREITTDEELQKEEQIRAIHHESCHVIFLRQANAGIIRISVLEIETHCRHNDSDNHLTDLTVGNPHRVEPLRSLLDGHQEIIKVHESVNGIVHCTENDTRRSAERVRMPAVKKYGHVMIPVKEDARLLVNDKEKCIDKLRELAQDKKHDPQSTCTLAISRNWISTEVFVYTLGCIIVHELRKYTDETDDGESGEEHVPQSQGFTPSK